MRRQGNQRKKMERKSRRKKEIKDIKKKQQGKEIDWKKGATQMKKQEKEKKREVRGRSK